MLTLNSLLDAARSASGIQSDYRLARVIGASDNTVYNWRHGISSPDEKYSLKLSELSHLPLPFVLNLTASMRTKDGALKAAYLDAARALMPSGSDKMPTPSAGGGSFKTSMDKGSAPDSASRRVDLSSYTSSPVSDGAALALACLSGIISRRERLKCPPVSHLENV